VITVVERNSGDSMMNKSIAFAAIAFAFATGTTMACEFTRSVTNVSATPLPAVVAGCATQNCVADEPTTPPAVVAGVTDDPATKVPAVVAQAD
jgi:hypothetical protein